MQLTHTTPRLDLTRLAPTDADFIIKLLNTPGWLAYIGDRNVHTEEDALAYIKRISDNPNVMYWVVRQKERSEALGIVTFLKREKLEHHDIGFAFLPQYGKQGFAYEATMAILAEALKEDETLMAITVPENTNSIRLLEKLGLSYQREMLDETEMVLVYSISADKFRIDTAIETFFQIFTNTKNEPDWERIHELCIPGTTIIKKAGTTQTVYTLESFIEPRRKILADGTLTDFEEKEIKEETKIAGNIAQRYSRYKKTGKRDGTPLEEYGNKLFQLVKTDNGWKISALIWEDD